jgi:hypothetical protein
MPKIILVILTTVIVLCGCKTNMVPYEAGKADSPCKVLIAGEDSEFKRNVVTRVIEILGTEECFFRVIGLNQIQEQETEQYDAIILITAYRAGRLDRRVTRYLSKDPQKAKTILFYTGESDDPMPEKNKPNIQVDAVSSASKDSRVDERAAQLVSLLEQRF